MCAIKRKMRRMSKNVVTTTFRAACHHHHLFPLINGVKEIIPTIENVLRLVNPCATYSTTFQTLFFVPSLLGFYLAAFFFSLCASSTVHIVSLALHATCSIWCWIFCCIYNGIFHQGSSIIR